MCSLNVAWPVSQKPIKKHSEGAGIAEPHPCQMKQCTDTQGWSSCGFVNSTGIRKATLKTSFYHTMHLLLHSLVNIAAPSAAIVPLCRSKSASLWFSHRPNQWSTEQLIVLQYSGVWYWQLLLYDHYCDRISGALFTVYFQVSDYISLLSSMCTESDQCSGWWVW